MAGPKVNLAKGWSKLNPQLLLEEETPVGLGCRISKGEAELHLKTKVRTVTYEMEIYLEMKFKEYCDVTGFDSDSSKCRTVPLPIPTGETKGHPACAPTCNGKCHRCTRCGNSMPLVTRMVGLCRLRLFQRCHRKRKSTRLAAEHAPQAASICMKLRCEPSRLSRSLPGVGCRAVHGAVSQGYESASTRFNG